VGLATGRIGRVGYNYASIKRAINTRHKTLIHEMIDNKKAEGYTFGVERRTSNTGKIYDGYLYRQKRNINGKDKEHISLKARNLDDYRDNVLLEQAKKEVFTDTMGGCANEGLTRSELKILATLCDECLTYCKRDDRNPIAERYIKQLGLKVKNRRYSTITIRPIKEKKKIIKAAQKALKKWDRSHRKLMLIIGSVLNRRYSPTDFANFIKNVVKESKCRNNVKRLQSYIHRCRERDSNSPYLILKPSEVKIIAEEVLWINKKSRKLSV
jgi:hypothetical protein